MPTNEDAHRGQHTSGEPCAHAKPVSLLRRLRKVATGVRAIWWWIPFEAPAPRRRQAARETGRSSILIEEQLGHIEKYPVPRGSALPNYAALNNPE